MNEALSDRENFIRTLEFRGPQWIPICFDMFPSVKMAHGDALIELLRAHPLVFGPEQVAALAAGSTDVIFKAGSFTDCWGCGWYNARGGNIGYVVDHPLADWSALDDLQVPDPLAQEDWQQITAAKDQQRRRGETVHGGASSFSTGGFFDRLQFLRGLENLLVDLATGPPQLERLIGMVLDFNMREIGKWMEIGVDIMHFHGDLATQRGMMMSPATFRKYLKPAYKEMFQACRKSGAHVHYSSDGNLLEIVDDLIECGVSCHDPQVRANGIDAIAENYKGKLCALVDIDEQMLPFCTPGDIDDQVREIIDKVASPEGGLVLYACPSEDVPLQNIEAICVAWENNRFL